MILLVLYNVLDLTMLYCSCRLPSPEERLFNSYYSYLGAYNLLQPRLHTHHLLFSSRGGYKQFYVYLVLITFLLWQINKAAGNQTQTTAHDQEIDESEDEEDVEEHFYGENDNESDLSSDDGKNKGKDFCFCFSHIIMAKCFI